MNSQVETLKEIERYLAGEMPDGERAEFELRLKNQLKIKDDVELTRRLIDAIKGHGFKQMIKRIAFDEFGYGQASQTPPSDKTK